MSHPTERRDWKDIHRYVLHWFTLQDGSRGQAGIVSYLPTASAIELGYMYTPSGQLIPMQAVDFPLWQHGERGCPPEDYGFSFKAGGTTYNVQVEVLESPEFRIGWEWEGRIMERFSRYRVNGIEGWGIAEWAYQQRGDALGRPLEVARNDPQHISK